MFFCGFLGLKSWSYCQSQEPQTFWHQWHSMLVYLAPHKLSLDTFWCLEAVELRNHSEVLPNFTAFLKDILGVRKLVTKKLPREIFNSWFVSDIKGNNKHIDGKQRREETYGKERKGPAHAIGMSVCSEESWLRYPDYVPRNLFLILWLDFFPKTTIYQRQLWGWSVGQFLAYCSTPRKR